MLRKPLSLELVKMAICLQGEREMGQLGGNSRQSREGSLPPKAGHI